MIAFFINAYFVRPKVIYSINYFRGSSNSFQKAVSLNLKDFFLFRFETASELLEFFPVFLRFDLLLFMK